VDLKGVLHRLRLPPRELDEESLRKFCGAREDCTPIAEAQPREQISVVGEIACVSIVPQPDGSPWLEVTVSDGTGSLIAMWTGRRKIAGVKPGQRLVVSGRGAATGPKGRLVIYNPHYELLA
jgi:hypothetical protein